MKRLALVLTACLLLQACAAAVVVGTGVAVSAGTDRRTLGAQVDDKGLYLKIVHVLSEDEELWTASKISVEVLNARVLLIGQTPEQRYANRATELTRNVEGVVEVLNEMRLKEPVSLSTRSNDTWITTKIRSKLLTNPEIPLNKIRVTTEDSEVFLIGIVTKEEEDIAVDIARHEKGVSKVIKVFERAEIDES
ncbi:MULTISPECIES: division/outer membrane stress-associated lipid-binding lipoprotein [Aliagarivorans]|uniref:division/outer membrane stress-associated lipid-binding lipoprotein n=1 Tax=Aliagarivorans TaxID=882379 RepID=UPI000425312A|nr:MULTISPECIES: division/outer membrane stress-associated lipid-binding lipoprotein [Aliagarivorans]